MPLSWPHHRYNNRCGQLDYFNYKVSVAQVKTCVDSWEKHILRTTEFILRSHFLGHLCDDSRMFVSHLADTVYNAITELTNKITYDCRHNRVSYTAKFKEAVGPFINESGNVKYQWVLALRTSKFTQNNTSY